MKGFQEHDLMSINPRDEQFEPTEAQPIRQQARMAGDPRFSLRPPTRIPGGGKSIVAPRTVPTRLVKPKRKKTPTPRTPSHGRSYSAQRTTKRKSRARRAGSRRVNRY